MPFSLEIPCLAKVCMCVCVWNISPRGNIYICCVDCDLKSWNSSFCFLYLKRENKIQSAKWLFWGFPTSRCQNQDSNPLRGAGLLALHSPFPSPPFVHLGMKALTGRHHFDFSWGDVWRLHKIFSSLHMSAKTLKVLIKRITSKLANAESVNNELTVYIW